MSTKYKCVFVAGGDPTLKGIHGRTEYAVFHMSAHPLDKGQAKDFGFWPPDRHAAQTFGKQEARRLNIPYKDFSK
jgi:hypothetical protein